MDSVKTVPEEAPYGLWHSDMAIESLFDRSIVPMYPFRYKGSLHWFEAQPNQGGRIALMRKTDDGESICITPQRFNIRTRVHEYGGRCFCIADDSIIFNNYSDGLLYRQNLDFENEPELIFDATQVENNYGFADLMATPDGKWVIGVLEVSQKNAENINSIVAISLTSAFGARNNQAKPLRTLIKGACFYASPKISNNGDEIAWIEWDHPCMPWDQTRLVSAKLVSREEKLELQDMMVVCDEADRSVCQIGFVSGNRLLFISDSRDCAYWNFFQYADSMISQLTDTKSEFGEPHWVFGQNRWLEVDNGRVVAVATEQTEDRILLIDLQSGNCTELDQGFPVCGQLELGMPGEILFVAHYSDRPAEIVALDYEDKSITIKSRTKQPIIIHDISKPKTITFPTGRAQDAITHAYAYFYSPYNLKFAAPKATRPPLIAMLHGGPTGRVTSEYYGLKQFFCSLGYAVIDVNYRGSSGYGRRFRQSLLGNWGEYDVADVIAAINFVIEKNWVDPNLVFIRGGSAGGYAVLRSLTCHPAQFAGAACYYGIGNLITLSEKTHKFESRYTEQLIGENYDSVTAIRPNSRYRLRSPIFEIDNVKCPLILFQGEDDKITPPEMSREIAARVKQNGLKYRYTEYPDEGHGFRRVETRVDALKQETDFFSEIIRNKLNGAD